MEKRGSKNKILFLGFLLLVLIFLIILTYVKDCGEDKKCFLDSLKSCKKAKVYLESDNAVFSYEILGQKEDKCVTLITLERLNSNVNNKLKEQIEKKKMVCEIPKSESDNLFNTKEASAYCTGPLREIFLQISLEKLYSFIVNSLGQTAVKITNITAESGIPESTLY